MTRFLLLTKYGGAPEAGPMAEWSPDDIEAHLAYLRALNRELIENGELVEAQALTGPELAKAVASDEHDAPVITDGPFAEVKEMLAGYQLRSGRRPEQRSPGSLPAPRNGSRAVHLGFGGHAERRGPRAEE